MSTSTTAGSAGAGNDFTDKHAKEWYDQHDKPYGVRGNVWSRVWGKYRNQTSDFRKAVGAKQDIRRLQREWLGDVSDKHVLELGCNDGTVITLELAKNAKTFIGVDLSDPAILKLQEKLRSEGCERSVAVCADFLTSDFGGRKFDIIYTNSVIHHFKDRDEIFQALCDKLADGGRVVCLEPIDTSWMAWLAHECSRPVVEDAAFNFPFHRRTFDQIAQYFEIEKVQGFLGYSKYSLPLSWIPPLRGLAQWLGRKGHARDMQAANRLGTGLWRCMSVLLVLRKRGAT